MNKLKYYRSKIDVTDRNIVKLLLLRFKLARQIANYKRRNNIKIADKKRERQIIKNIKKYKKHQKFFQKIFGDIINYSKKIQK